MKKLSFNNKILFHSFEMKLELKAFFGVPLLQYLAISIKKYEDCYCPDICSALYFWSATVNHFIGVVTSQEFFSFSSLLDTHFFN